MEKFERIFNDFIQRKFRPHDRIQKEQDDWLQRKTIEIQQLERLAKDFEAHMEQTASRAEQWLEKHMRRKNDK